MGPAPRQGERVAETPLVGGSVAPKATVRILQTADLQQLHRVIEVTGDGLLFGRGEGDVIVADPSVSRRHAEIRPVQGGFEISDLGSSNGTWIGDQRISQHRLRDGDQFRLGQVLVEYRIEPVQPPGAPVASAPKHAPAPESAPQPEPTPEPEPAPKPVPRSEPAPKPEPPAAPVPKPEPKPKPEPPAAPEPKPEPEPKPVAKTEPPPEPAPPPPPKPLDNVTGLTLTEVFKQEGQEVLATGNRPFLISEPEAVWYVESGKVELFTVAVEDGLPKGARNHFVTVVEGSLMMGMDPDLFQVGSGFLAVGSINTVLRRVGRPRLEELAEQEHLAGTVAEWIDGWVASLADGLTDEISKPPLDEITLIPGESVTLPRQHQACPNKGVVWLEVASGKVLFIGMEELSLEEQSPRRAPRGDSLGLQDLVQAAKIETALFPVSTRSWVEALVFGDPGTHVQIEPSSAVVGRPAFWRGIDAFHRVVCQCEFINKRLSQVDELNRLKSKEEYSGAARRQGLADLASILRPRGEPVIGGSKAGDEAVFEAARVVGEALTLTVRQHPEHQREKTFEGRVAAIAKASRFRVRQIALRDNWWEQDSGPILGKLGADGSPVALLPNGPKSYVCINPADGSRNIVTDDLAQTIDSFGVSFYRPFPEGPLTARQLVKFGILGLGHDLRWLLMMGILLGVLGTLTPIFTGKLFDSAIPQADRNLLVQFTTGLFLAAAIAAAFKITQSIAVLRIQGRMDYSIQAAMWDRLLDLPSTFFRSYSSGDLADRVGGIARIRDLVAGAGISAILGSVSSVFYVFLLFKYSIPLAVLAMGLTFAFVAFTFSANFIQLRLQRDHMRLQGLITGMVLQFISGVSKLRVAGAENHAFSVWAREFAEQRRLEFGIGRVQNAVAVFSSSFSVISSMAIFYVLYKARQSGAESGAATMSTGDFVAFTAAYGAFLAAMTALSEASLNMLRIVPVFERLKPIITEVSEIDETKAYPGTLKGALELINVQFRYTDDGPWILKGVSLKINPGEMVAFVGGSGSGKSTLLRLMLGFETPDRGVIYYDGQDLSSVDVRELRQQLGVVLQDAKVMPADIFHNIIGASDLTLEHAWEAAKMAGLDADIKELPMGMHTYVSEGGGGFSGGQIQRLLIARALVKKPRILFFDEATSALDNRSQATVTESMERLFATRIVIAHRLSTIVNADRICYLDQGLIAESGTYQELMELDGLFAALAKRQLA
jgi:ATP-binding cassette subfamily C protein